MTRFEHEHDGFIFARPRLHARYENPAINREHSDSNIEVTQMNFPIGNNGDASAKHGFWRKNLTPEEREMADALADAIRANYELDPVVDEMTLQVAVVAYVRAFRQEPSQGAGDEVRAWMNKFREMTESLGLNRKTRNAAGSEDAIAKTLAEMRAKK